MWSPGEAKNHRPQNAFKLQKNKSSNFAFVCSFSYNLQKAQIMIFMWASGNGTDTTDHSSCIKPFRGVDRWIGAYRNRKAEEVCQKMRNEESRA